MDIQASSHLAEIAIAYLEEMGGVERSPFPEAWGYIHDGKGASMVPAEIAKGIRDEDGGLVEVAFFELKSGDRPVEPGEGWGGVAVVHDEPRRPRAFVFDDIEAFDDTITDSDIRGMLHV